MSQFTDSGLTEWNTIRSWFVWLPFVSSMAGLAGTACARGPCPRVIARTLAIVLHARNGRMALDRAAHVRLSFGFRPAERIAFSFCSNSNQSGAPSDASEAVISKPTILASHARIQFSNHPPGFAP